MQVPWPLRAGGYRTPACPRTTSTMRRAGRRLDPYAGHLGALVSSCSNSVERAPQGGSTPTRWWPSAAAIQAGGLKGEVKDVLLLDADPAQPGHRDQGWRHATKLHRAQYDDPDPSAPRVFTTAEGHGQPSVEIHVLQGEREMAHVQQDDVPGEVPAGRPASRPTRRARRSRSPSTSMPTASCTWWPRTQATGKEQSMTITGHRPRWRRTTSTGWSGATPRPTPPTTAVGARRRPRCAIRPTASSTRPRRC